MFRLALCPPFARLSKAFHLCYWSSVQDSLSQSGSAWKTSHSIGEGISFREYVTSMMKAMVGEATETGSSRNLLLRCWLLVGAGTVKPGAVFWELGLQSLFETGGGSGRTSLRPGALHS